MLNVSNGSGPDEVHDVVLAELGEMLASRNREVAVREEMNLNSDLGLTSLDLAELVAVLEQRLQRSPFRNEVAITSVRSVADLCAAFRGGSQALRANEEAFLERAMRRALDRRGAPALP